MIALLISGTDEMAKNGATRSATPPDLGLSATLSGHTFAPIAGSVQAGAFLVTGHGRKPSEAVRQLVHLGPHALPFLLDALDDETPTRLEIRRKGIFEAMWFARELWGNPVNAREQKAVAAFGKTVWNWLTCDLASYTVKVGDVCFVAIGQIVGRQYQAVRYQPTACIVINSPTHDATLARQVRAIWASENPSQHLLDSLLLDYATRGIFNGHSLDGWDVGSDLQIEAAMRLLYYFPRQTASMIADRLRRLKVVAFGPGSASMHTRTDLDASMKQDVANQVRAEEFVKAVAWSKEPAIRATLLGIFQRMNPKSIRQRSRRR